MIDADHQLAGGPSIFFDAVVVAASEEGSAMLEKEAAAVDWIRDAFGHLKVIGVLESALGLAEEAGVEEDEGVVEMDGAQRHRGVHHRGEEWPRVGSRAAAADPEVIVSHRQDATTPRSCYKDVASCAFAVKHRPENQRAMHAPAVRPSCRRARCFSWRARAATCRCCI